MKIITLTTVGRPKPPLRMIAPRGAPTKKKNKQARDNVNLRCHSIQWVRIKWSPSLVTALRHSRSAAKAAALAWAIWRADCNRSGEV